MISKQIQRRIFIGGAFAVLVSAFAMAALLGPATAQVEGRFSPLTSSDTTKAKPQRNQRFLIPKLQPADRVELSAASAIIEPAPAEGNTALAQDAGPGLSADSSTGIKHAGRQVNDPFPLQGDCCPNCGCSDCCKTLLPETLVPTSRYEDAFLTVWVVRDITEPYCEKKCDPTTGVCEEIVGTRTVRKLVKRLRKEKVELDWFDVVLDTATQHCLKCGVHVRECSDFHTFYVTYSNPTTAWALGYTTALQVCAIQPRYEVDLPSTANWRVQDYGAYSLISPADKKYNYFVLDYDIATKSFKLTDARTSLPETARWRISITQPKTLIESVATGLVGSTIFIPNATTTTTFSTSEGDWQISSNVILAPPPIPVPSNQPPTPRESVFNVERPRSWVAIP